MITVRGDEFRLDTEHTSYWFRKTAFAHLEHIYYGSRLPVEQAMEPLAVKRDVAIGASVM